MNDSFSRYESGSSDGSVAYSSKHASFLRRGIGKKQLAVYTRQVATLLKSGVPIVQALKVLEKQETRGPIAKMLRQQIGEVEGGFPYSQSMFNQPHIFDSIYTNLVVAGEKAGMLESVMERLANYLEKSIQTNGKIKAAMTYPAIVLFASIVIVIGLLIFVVPQFEEIFKDMLQGAELPVMTQWVLGASEFFKANWMYVFAGLVIARILFTLSLRVSFFQTQWDQIKLQVPVFGKIIKHSLLGRFNRTLGTLMDSAVPVLSALETASKSINNRFLEDIFDRVAIRVQEGESIAKPMEREKAIPAVMTGMIEVGEVSGELPRMLLQVAETYEQEVDVTVDGLTTMIEPMMILILAVVVGFLVIALFLPIVEVMQQLGA